MKTNLHSIRHQSFKLIATLLMLLFTNVCYAKLLDVTLTEGGTLSQFIPKEDYASITELKVSGPFNSEDLDVIKNLTKLEILDLSDIYLVEGEKYYYETYQKQSSKEYDYTYFYTSEKDSISNKHEHKGYPKPNGYDCYYHHTYCNDLRYAFCPYYNNHELYAKRLYWPKSVKKIGNYAFSGSDLRTIYISEDIEDIDSLSFKGANLLENVFINSNNKKYKDINGTVYCKTNNEKIFEGRKTGFVVSKAENKRSFLYLYIDTLKSEANTEPLKLISVTCNGKTLISKGKGWEGDLWVLKGVYFKEREVVITYKEGDIEKQNVYTYPATNPYVDLNLRETGYTSLKFEVIADEGASEVGIISNNKIIAKGIPSTSVNYNYQEGRTFWFNDLPWGSFGKYYGYAIYEGDTIMSGYTICGTNSAGSYIISKKTIITPTSCTVKGTFNVGEQYIDSCGWEISDMKTAWGTTKWTNKLTHKFVDLVPGKTYYAYFIVDAKGQRYRSDAYEFFAPSVTFENLPTDMVSNTTARISANTNCDATHNIGFEWRKYDAPNLVPSTYSECPVINGKLSGTLNNLSANTYYKYRPYYKDAKGDYTYGDWLAFGTSDAYAYFKPDVFTSTYEQNEQSIKLTGYVIGGSDKITKQGFEYWTSKSPNKTVLESTGQYMQAEIKGLISGATYSYRTFATTSKETIYGDTFEFSVPNTTGINHAEQNTEEMQIYFNSQKGIMVSVADKANSNCSYRINNINGDNVETGKIVADENWHSVKKLLPGIYIIRVSNLKESKIIKVAIK